ncbi:MAG: tetraacyldisaccharide 4'-kinase [Candidatus Latescibacterota bacterium]|nr:MAG: tetraacyldisaccharide 4'-kinase [Candidatus Latescibacterota bacterium]
MRLRVAAGRLLLRLMGSTWRVEWHGEERFAEARRQSPGGNVIYALWHGSLAMLTYTHRDQDAQVLVSQHRDGEWIARILEGLGYGLVRGSSRRGGVEGLFGLAKQLERGRDVAVTVDGPIGPRYRVHPGALLLARRTGRPIVPVIATPKHGFALPTWDAQRLPWPGTRVRVQRGEPFWVAADVREAQLQTACRELEATLHAWSRHEERVFGRAFEARDVQDRRSWVERRSEEPGPPLVLRAVAVAHSWARQVERRVRPRPSGLGARPWVVGIGNLEAGGTGKTPCVVALARALLEHGAHPAVITRGHRGQLGRRHPTIVNHPAEPGASDETRLLAEALGEEVPIVVARRKRDGLELLRRRGDVDVVLVDDALQTAALAVDRHLVLLDWENPLGNGHLIPAGRLREPPQALRRAHALLFTRARAQALPRHPAWAHLEPERCFLARETILGLHDAEGRSVDPESLRRQGVLLLSGVGRPRAFERACAELAERHRFDVRRVVRMSDHAELDRMLEKQLGRMQGIGCEVVVLTRKDFLRLQQPKGKPLLVLEQRLALDSVGRLLRILVPEITRLRNPQTAPRETPARGFPRPR